MKKIKNSCVFVRDGVILQTVSDNGFALRLMQITRRADMLRNSRRDVAFYLGTVVIM